MVKNPLQLVNELAQELTKLQELVTAIHDAESRVESHELTDYDLRARGSILHDLYQGMESICLRIFKAIDEKEKPAESKLDQSRWHQELIERMSNSLPGVRPAVLTTQTAERMKAFRGFRHVFHHTYGTEMNWKQMQPLWHDAINMLNVFTADIENFIAALRMKANDL
jgi:hypothetical protein